MDSYVPSLQRSMVAGAAAHMIEILTLGHILDRLKIDREAFLDRKSFLFSKQSLYKGLLWNLLSSGSKGSFGWVIHNLSIRIMSQNFPLENPSRPSFFFTFATGLLSGTLESLVILCPLERIKIVEMTQNESMPFKVKEFIKREGFLSLYRGWDRMIFRQSISWVSYLFSYQVLREHFLVNHKDEPLPICKKMQLGFLTGAFAACISAPFDLLKTQAQKAHSADISLQQTAQKIFHSYGVQGFYRGLPFKLLRNAWSSMVVLLVLQHLKALPKHMEI